jgi:hypothetical protein
MERTIQLHEINEKRWHPVYVEMTERRGWPVVVITVTKNDRRRAFLAANTGNPEMQGILARHGIVPVLFRGKDLVNMRDILDFPRSTRVFDGISDIGFDCTTEDIKNEICHGHGGKALTMMASPPSIDWIKLEYMHAFEVEVHASGVVTIRDKDATFDAFPAEDRFDDMVKTVLGHVARMAPGRGRWRS